MDRRFLRFLTVSFVLYFGYILLVQHFYPRKPARPPANQQQAAREEPAGQKKPAAKSAEKKPAGKTAKTSEKTAEKTAKREKPTPTVMAAREPEQPEQLITLGSADPNPAKNPYRMLVTLTTKGAALARVELSSDRYRDVDERFGYLGNLGIVDGKQGPVVRVVGPGTPAAEAGLKVGDVIRSVDRRELSDEWPLERMLRRTRPNQTIQLAIVRNGKTMTLTAKLRRRPLDVVRPEDNDPLSMLLTLSQVDKLKLRVQWARDLAIWQLENDLKASDQQIAELDLADVVNGDEEQKVHLRQQSGDEKQWFRLTEAAAKALGTWQSLRGDKGEALFITLPEQKPEKRLSADDIRRVVARVHDEQQGQGQPGLAAELAGIDLRRGTWKLVTAGEDRAVFRRALPQWGLELTKTYRLVQVPEASRTDPDYPAYHLEFDIEIRNAGGESRRVAYQLDGPNGLPKEGDWYASKVSRNWGGSGLRDFVVSFDGGTPGMVNTTTIAADGALDVYRDTPERLLSFVGIDAQYFSAVLMPERAKHTDVWFDELTPIRVGKIDPKQTRLVNVSCRLTSAATLLEEGETLRHTFKLFAGPKRPTLLGNKSYGLGELVYYGWPIFSVVAVPLTKILHVFYYITWNYGLAIILLTVLVRGCMFPISLKQAAGAQKMQQLQPEMKKLQEKYKNNAEARAKAQQELFRKHNYNPLSGCLPVLIQMPIFIGLYRCLMVDIELRDAPLISHAIRWCSNLAAPDMLFDWSRWMPAWFNSGQGMFSLGPYFNILPLLTVGLMLWQQKMFMPPPADEQAAMQQKMMNFMMIFMGLLFFKVASGLCIYFIASSLWGIGERRLLPKAAAAPGTPGPGGTSIPPVGSGDFGETRAQAKARERAGTTKRK
ncbi:MAG: YidC/Oxa1 family insertase periplasmic-domain containing protein [Thermoguttaceae bacterium]